MSRDRLPQVLLDYGPRSNAQLLNTHGFALPTTAHEQLQLELRPPVDDPLAPLKVRILEAGNLTSPYSLGRSSLSSDSDLLVALRVLAATRDELAGSEQTGDKGRGYARAFEGSPISQGNELRWQEMLARRLRPLLEEREARCGMRRGLHATRCPCTRALPRASSDVYSTVRTPYPPAPAARASRVHSRVEAGRPPHRHRRRREHPRLPPAHPSLHRGVGAGGPLHRPGGRRPPRRERRSAARGAAGGWRCSKKPRPSRAWLAPSAGGADARQREADAAAAARRAGGEEEGLRPRARCGQGSLGSRQE
mmetsp:Transcript_10259/g.32431  ORF Transcript_10259/g.32431 Transcript_10259/m.32431 type:complete len:308 (+) Transcript_10259:1074-1997(+)